MSTTAGVKLTKNGKPDRRSVRREEHLEELERYIAKPRTVPECAKKLAVTERAIYFLFELLNARGKTVARIGPKAGAKYTLLS